MGIFFGKVHFRFQGFPFRLLVKIFPVKQPGFQVFPAFFIKLLILGNVFAQLPAHNGHGLQRPQVEGGTHGVCAPELNVVGIVVGFL